MARAQQFKGIVGRATGFTPETGLIPGSGDNMAPGGGFPFQGEASGTCTAEEAETCVKVLESMDADKGVFQ